MPFLATHPDVMAGAAAPPCKRLPAETSGRPAQAQPRAARLVLEAGLRLCYCRSIRKGHLAAAASVSSYPASGGARPTGGSVGGSWRSWAAAPAAQPGGTNPPAAHAIRARRRLRCAALAVRAIVTACARCLQPRRTPFATNLRDGASTVRCQAAAGFAGRGCGERASCKPQQPPGALIKG